MELYLCSGRGQSREFFFNRAEVPWGGGEYKKKEGKAKALRLGLVLVDYLDLKGGLIMKLDQVSG